jgi:hypothetical protein
MPRVMNCPNCRAPLTKPAEGPDARCEYCGAMLAATTYQPAPNVPPGAGGPAFPVGNSPQAPNAAWQQQQQAVLAAQQMAARMAAHQAKSTAGGAITSIVVTLIIMGAVGGISFFAYRASQEQVEKAQEAAEQAIAPVRLSERKMEIGKWTEVELPGSTPTSGGPVVATFKLEVAQQGVYEVTALASAAYVQCQIKLLDAKDVAIARADASQLVQIHAILLPGTFTVTSRCDSHPSERTLKVIARPVPVLAAGEPLPVRFEADLKTTGCTATIAEAGRYAFALESDDSSDALEVIGADDQAVGKESLNSSAGRAIVEAALEPGDYLVRVTRTFDNSSDRQVVFALTRNDPTPIGVGEPLTGTLNRFVAARYHEFQVNGDPIRLEAILDSQAFDHVVEIQRENGVRIVTSGQASTGRTATATPADALSAGRYRLVVKGPDHQPAEGEYRLTVQPVEQDAPRRTGRGGR